MNFQHSIDWFWHRVERKTKTKQENKKNRKGMRENKTDETILSIES